MYSVILSIGILPDELKETIVANPSVNWWTIKDDGSRAFVDAIIDNLAVIETMGVTLASFNPIIIGVWNEDGTQVEDYPFNETEYFNWAEVEEEVHQFFGWAKREMYEQDTEIPTE
jgi:hypothetical protein